MIRAWRNLFKPHILERGLDYYEEEAVVSLEEIAIGYKAFPEKVRDAYVSLVRKEAVRVSDRKRYKELVKY